MQFDVRPTCSLEQPDLSNVSFSALREGSSPPWATATSCPMEFAHRLSQQDERLLRVGREISQAVKELSPNPEYGFAEPRALAVGGFVRDTAMNLRPKDLDVEVYGVDPVELKALLNKLYPEKVDVIGESFRVLQVHLNDGLNIDVSIPRRDSKVGPKHRDFVVQGDPTLTVADAARRRDFTWNSMAADLLTGEIIDPFGGLTDLEQGMLRVTDPSHFTEDPLRVYRAAQFTGRFQLEIEPQTMLLLSGMVSEGALDNLPSKRVTDELSKLLLKSEKPSVGFELMQILGMTRRYFPDVEALAHVPQDSEHHPEGDVFVHTMMVIDAAASLIRDPGRTYSEREELKIMLGALCHDFGKPVTTGVNDEQIRSADHGGAGEAPVKDFFRTLEYGGEIEKSVVTSTVTHHRPGELYHGLETGGTNEQVYVNEVRKFMRSTGPDDLDFLLAVAEADSRGRGLPDAATAAYPPVVKLLAVAELHDLRREATEKLVTGRDLIAFGVKPSRLFGEIIAEVEKARDDGLIQTRAEALEMVREILAERP
jgi:tRNA nucleotidyltransferase (CCA-adding enzyme)